MYVRGFIDEDADPGEELRLDLNDPEGWRVGAEFDLGRRTKTKTYISQPGYDGATLTTADLGLRQITLPLYMAKQSDVEAMLDLYDALIDELDRPTNVLEIVPAEETSILIDTYSGDVDAILNGRNLPDIFERLNSGGPIIVTLDRAPASRGDGTYL